MAGRSLPAFLDREGLGRGADGSGTYRSMCWPRVCALGTFYDCLAPSLLSWNVTFANCLIYRSTRRQGELHEQSYYLGDDFGVASERYS